MITNESVLVQNKQSLYMYTTNRNISLEQYLYTVNQGWQKPGCCEYCLAQWEILGKHEFYLVLVGNTGQYWVI